MFSFTENSCRTPNRLNGNCISLRQCQPLYNLIANSQEVSDADREFLRQSQCGYEGRNPLVRHFQNFEICFLLSMWMLFEFKVCCPLDAGTPTSFPGGSGLSQSDFPRPGSCGPVVVEKIVGGNTTTISDYPW